MKIFFILLCLCFTLEARADYWDNLSQEEAQFVVAELKRNPFIFAYCDCCGNALVLVKVTKTEIIPCTWNEGQFSVQYESVAIAEFTRVEEQHSLSSGSPASPNSESTLVAMNYTWTVNPTTKLAVPFFDVVNYTYYENQSCEEPFNFPHPSEVGKASKLMGYKGWYKKTIAN